eukprot:789288-Pyramimonas_sp.AAC.1
MLLLVGTFGEVGVWAWDRSPVASARWGVGLWTPSKTSYSQRAPLATRQNGLLISSFIHFFRSSKNSPPLAPTTRPGDGSS